MSALETDTGWCIYVGMLNCYRVVLFGLLNCYWVVLFGMLNCYRVVLYVGMLLLNI
jgi:hypothetical protein